jgi:polyisoprenoid-binding protein YceI
MFYLAGVDGSFALASGQLTVTEPIAASSVTAAAAAKSFTTGNRKRDMHVRSEAFLHSEVHAEIAFQFSGLFLQDRTWSLRGNLTARGNSAPLILTVLDTSCEGDTVTVHGVDKADRYAHQITNMKGMTGRHVKIDITAYATRI